MTLRADTGADAACTLAKAQLRRQMIVRREQLTPLDLRLAAEGFRRNLPAFLKNLDLPPRPLRLAVYAAMRHEADLAMACTELALQGHEIYYPAVQGRGVNARLVFACLPAGSQTSDFLVPGCFGVSEPPPASWLAEIPHFDLMLMPGLAFDRSGNRLGWGRAFYDRLIPALPGRPLLVGVCYPFQIVADQVPCTPDDQRVDWLLTPDQFISCQESLEKLT